MAKQHSHLGQELNYLTIFLWQVRLLHLLYIDRN